MRPDRVRLIHNGISLDCYQWRSNDGHRALREKLGIRGEDFVVGTAGRLDRQKAHYCLLEATAKLKEMGIPVKCLIAGNGPLKMDLEEARQRMNLNNEVLLTGYRKDILNIMEILDVFVITSVDEELPMVLLEAMAMKKAIVSTPVGEIGNVIHHGANGLLYPVGDVEQFYLKANR